MHADRPRLPSRIRARQAIALVTALVTAGLLVAGCGSGNDSQSGATDVATVVPATPSPAPAGPATPAGVIIPTPAGASASALSGSKLGVLGPGGTSVLRFDTASMSTPPTTITTPRLQALTAAFPGAFVGVGPGSLVRIAEDGTVLTTPLDTDDPTAVTRTTDGRYLVGTGNGHVLVIGTDLKVQRDIGGFVRVDEITVSPPGADLGSEQVVVLDRAQSSVTPIDLATGNLGPALRAGNGATNATVDHYGRVLVANTRDNEILGFFGSPLVMRFRYPVPEGPYAVDYDDTRNLLWVTTTGNNEAVAYDLAGGEPIEKHRFSTVAQPDSLIVDDKTGVVYVLSARDGGIEVVPPAQQTGSVPMSSGPVTSAPATSAPATSTPVTSTPGTAP
ncbi:YncE family protein [Gordonia sp. NPDC003950]